MASTGTYADSNFNLAAQGHRQPGSAFKTFVLTTAIRKGIDPNTTYYTSKPLNIDDPTYGHWEVKTFGNSYMGTVSLTRATLASDNTVYAQLILDLGPKKVCETAKLLGITTKLDCYPAEGLGGLTLGVTPLEMAGAYATLASGGIRHRPTGSRRSCSPTARARTSASSEGKRVLTDGEAYEVTQGPASERARRARAPRRTTAARRPERPARRMRRRTPGSSATRRSCPPPCGWAIRRPASRCRARRAAPTPHRYGTRSWTPAHGTSATTSRLRPSPPSSRPYFGKYARTGSSGSGSYYGPGTGSTTRPTPDQEVRPALLRAGAARPAEPGPGRGRRAAGAGAATGTATATAMGTASPSRPDGRAGLMTRPAGSRRG